MVFLGIQEGWFVVWSGHGRVGWCKWLSSPFDDIGDWEVMQGRANQLKGLDHAS